MNTYPLSRNTRLLAIAQALSMSAAPMMIFIGGIIGSLWAPSPQLATLPIACFIVGTALSMWPIARLQQRFGRKRVFIGGGCYGALIATITAWFVSLQSFWGVSLGAALLGSTAAITHQYRFAAMESVAPEKHPQAVAMVLLGGIGAAWLGPELGVLGRHLFTSLYTGSFLLLAGVFLCVALLQTAFIEPLTIEETMPEPARPFRELIRQPVLWVAVSAAVTAYAIMSLIMTATPVSMHQIDGHPLQHAKIVIQLHITAMFLPSLFSGWLGARFGLTRMMLLGWVIYVACTLIAINGQSLTHYHWALILLGIGWNFLFVSATGLLPRAFRNSERFRVQALNDSCVFSVQALASLSAGWVLTQWHWTGLNKLCLPLLALEGAILIAWVFAKNHQDK